MKQQQHSKFSSFETSLMKKLIKKAERYRGFTYPNPLVAAAIYKGSTVISYGVHKKHGDNHAEVDAIKQAKGSVKGASIMITLEPCTHTGLTPPCVSAIIKSEIKEVIFAVEDPCDLVRKKSAKTILEDHGIIVRSGLLRDEAYQLNHDYMYCHHNKKPFIHLKAGMSLDGKIALASGESCYITNELSRKKVHEIRSQVNAIVIGSGTLHNDNPKLTVRYDYLKKNQIPPSIIVFSNNHNIDKSSHAIFESGYRIILVTSNPKIKGSHFSEVWLISNSKSINQIDLNVFLKKCYENKLYGLLIEGGSELYSTFLNAGIVNKCSFFIAPKLFGQADAKNFVELEKVTSLSDILTLDNIQIEQYGNDVCISGFCCSS